MTIYPEFSHYMKIVICHSFASHYQRVMLLSSASKKLIPALSSSPRTSLLHLSSSHPHHTCGTGVRHTPRNVCVQCPQTWHGWEMIQQTEIHHLKIYGNVWKSNVPLPCLQKMFHYRRTGMDSAAIVYFAKVGHDQIAIQPRSPYVLLVSPIFCWLWLHNVTSPFSTSFCCSHPITTVIKILSNLRMSFVPQKVPYESPKTPHPKHIPQNWVKKLPSSQVHRQSILCQGSQGFTPPIQLFFQPK